MNAKRGAAVVGALVAAAIGLSGCSVVEGLAIEGNMDVIYLSTASTTVLLDKGFTVGVKPVCTETDKKQKSYQCTGSTFDGQPIKVVVADGTVSDPIMQITVGSNQIFSGSASAVIAANAEVSP